MVVPTFSAIVSKTLWQNGQSPGAPVSGLPLMTRVIGDAIAAGGLEEEKWSVVSCSILSE